MKNKDYVLLKNLYYNHKEEYEELYKSRFHSSECVHLNLETLTDMIED